MQCCALCRLPHAARVVPGVYPDVRRGGAGHCALCVAKIRCLKLEI